MKHLIYLVSVFILLCFDFVWIGGIIPVWIFLTGLIISLNLGQLNTILSKILSKEIKKIIFYFFIYTFYIFIIKLFSDSFDFEYAVGIISVVSFITFLLVGYNLNTKDLLLVVSFSILMHSIFVIGQALGYSWAWDFVISLMSSKESISKATTDLVNERYYDNAFSAYGRVKGTNVHIHVFSSIIGSLAMFLFLAVKENLIVFKSILIRLIIFLTSLIGLMCLFLTFTRAIIIASLIVLLFNLLKFKNLYKNITILFFIVLFVIISYSYFFESIEFRAFDRLFTSFDNDASNADKVRLMTYKTSLDAISDSPFFGGGRYDFDVPPHNIILNIAVKFGILGLFFYLLAIWNLLKFYFKRRSMFLNKKHKTLVFLLGIVIFINLFNAMFHTNTYLNKSVYQLLFTAVIIGQILREEQMIKYLFDRKKI